jgi:hypothetical protein
MQHIAAVKQARPNESNTAGTERTARPRTESEAAETMWVHYRDNKAQFIADIREYRSSILSDLMRGVPVEQVFAPFVKPAEPVRPMRRAA